VNCNVLQRLVQFFSGPGSKNFPEHH
jgi:hypothetical protein